MQSQFAVTIYLHLGTEYGTTQAMSKTDKLIEKMRQNPRDWRIEDLKVIADRYNIEYRLPEYRQPGGNHVTFRFPSQQKLTVPAHKPIKPVYIKQFICLLDNEGEENETP
jgi:hypothetical protein